MLEPAIADDCNGADAGSCADACSGAAVSDAASAYARVLVVDQEISAARLKAKMYRDRVIKRSTPPDYNLLPASDLLANM